VLRELRYVAAGAPGALRSWRQLPDGLRVLRTMERTHPLDEHWYLAVLGVDPPLQGQGAGRAAVAPVLERCDEDGRPAYLETATTANVAWYSRLGFAVTEEHHIGPSRLTLWSMWREPRS
jgi:ribosomal protein S18 acetylase RimI-like enzyme